MASSTVKYALSTDPVFDPTMKFVNLPEIRIYGEDHMFDSNGTYWSLLDPATYDILGIEPATTKMITRAIEQSQFVTIRMLLDKYTTHYKCEWLVQIAIRKDKIDVLDFLAEYYSKDFYFGNRPDMSAKIHHLEWLFMHSKYVDPANKSSFSADAINMKSFDTFKWLIETYNKYGLELVISFKVIAYQITNLEQFIWVMENYKELESKENKNRKTKTPEFFISEVCGNAIYHNDLKFLNEIYLYCLETGTNFVVSKHMISCVSSRSNEFKRWICKLVDKSSHAVHVCPSFFENQIVPYSLAETTDLCKMIVDMYANIGEIWKDTSFVMNHAAKYGYFDVIKMIYQMVQNGLASFDSLTQAVTNASSKGHVEILNWIYEYCKTTSTTFLYTHHAIDQMDGYHKSTMEWWFRQHILDGIELKYTYSINYYVFRSHHFLDAFNQWIIMYENYGTKYKYESDTIDVLSRNGDIAALNRCVEMDQLYKFGFPYTKAAINYVTDPKVLDWWVQMRDLYGYPLLYSKTAMQRESRIEILDWWLNASKTYGLELIYHDDLLVLSEENLPVVVLIWWINSGLLTNINESLRQKICDCKTTFF